MSVTVAAFYKFVRIDDADDLRSRLLAELRIHAIKGTILLAAEGINGTISGTSGAIRAFLAGLRADSRFGDLLTKEAIATAHPFKRLKVKVKREIISFGHPGADPTTGVGTYVAPEDWNAVINDPDVLVLDTRNAYEVEIGTFKGAVDPNTRHFSDLPDYVKTNLDPGRHSKVAMFCTGGIRCEKASAYLLSLGFPEVYHLQGGILGYLSKIPSEDSLWTGACFVFDERESVDHEK